MIDGSEIAIRLGWREAMIFDFSDPMGTIQLIFSLLILFELIKFLDAEDQMNHLQERVAFYSGILGKVWGFVKSAGEGFLIIFRSFSRKEKDTKPDMKTDFSAIDQKDEQEEAEGGIEG